MIRGDIEFGVEGLMGEMGEIVGGGFGVNRSTFNIDLEIDSEDSAVVESFVGRLLDYLRSLPAPEGTHIVIRTEADEPKHIYL
jgi:hypothetical protein